jgi:hypothetical protein
VLGERGHLVDGQVHVAGVVLWQALDVARPIFGAAPALPADAQCALEGAQAAVDGGRGVVPAHVGHDVGGAAPGLAGAVLLAPAADALGVVDGGGGAAQVLRVGHVVGHQVDDARVAGNLRLPLFTGGAVGRQPQLGLGSLGITRSCARRQASVKADTADADTDLETTTGRGLDRHVFTVSPLACSHCMQALAS